MATATVPREKIPPPSPTIVTALVDSIDIGANVRTDVGDLAELTDSIRQHGVLQPIRIRPHGTDGGFTLVYGQRRLLAAREAGLTHITAVLDHGSDAVGRSVTQLVENLQRQDLNPLEEARALRQVLDADPQLTQAELARRIGRSAPYLSNALRILELDKKVLPLVESGQLSGAHAKALASLKGQPQREIAADAVRLGYSAHEVERRVQSRHAAAEREAEEVAKLAKWAEATETELIAAGAVKGTTTLTTPDGYSWSAEKELKALKARGWKVQTESWSRGKCDCLAFGIARSYDGRTRVVRRCVIRAHYAAKQQAAGKSDTDRYQRQEEERRLSYAQAEAVRKGIRDDVVSALEKLPPNIGRLLLWSVMDYNITDWVRDHKGDRKKPDAWSELCELEGRPLAEELAKHVLRHVDNRYNVKLDWPAIADAFGVSLPAPKPAAAKKGGKK